MLYIMGCTESKNNMRNKKNICKDSKVSVNSYDSSYESFDNIFAEEMEKLNLGGSYNVSCKN